MWSYGRTMIIIVGWRGGATIASALCRSCRMPAAVVVPPSTCHHRCAVIASPRRVKSTRHSCHCRRAGVASALRVGSYSVCRHRRATVVAPSLRGLVASSRRVVCAVVVLPPSHCHIVASSRRRVVFSLRWSCRRHCAAVASLSRRVVVMWFFSLLPCMYVRTYVRKYYTSTADTHWFRFRFRPVQGAFPELSVPTKFFGREQAL